MKNGLICEVGNIEIFNFDHSIPGDGLNAIIKNASGTSTYRIYKICGDVWHCHGCSARSLPKLALKLAAKIIEDQKKRDELTARKKLEYPE